MQMLMRSKLIVDANIVFIRNHTETIILPCKVDFVSLEVFGFDLNKVFNEDLGILNKEYLDIDGLIEDVYGTSECDLMGDDDFWYWDR